MEENAQQQNQADNFISFFMPEDKENPQSLEPQFVLNTYTLDYEKNLEIAQNILLEHPEWNSAMVDRVEMPNDKETTNLMWDEDFIVKHKNPEFAKLREEKAKELETNKGNSQSKAQGAEKTQEPKVNFGFEDFDEYAVHFSEALAECKNPKAQRQMLDSIYEKHSKTFDMHCNPRMELKKIAPISTFAKDKGNQIKHGVKSAYDKTKEYINDKREIKQDYKNNLKGQNEKRTKLNQEIRENAKKLTAPKDIDEFVKALLAIIDAAAVKRAMNKDAKEAALEAFKKRKEAAKLAKGLPNSYAGLIDFAAKQFTEFKGAREQLHKEHEFHQKFTKAMDMKASPSKIQDLMKQAGKEAPNFAKTYPNTFKRAESIVKLGKEQGKSQYQGRSA